MSAEKAMGGRRKSAEGKAEKQRALLYAKYPEARHIEQQISQAAIKAAKAVLNGSDTKEQLSELKSRNLALQKRLAEILHSAGLEDDALEPHYSCGKCKDTGYVDGKMCACMKDLLRSEAYRELNSMTPLALSTFDDFSLGYYSASAEGDKPPARVIMKRTLDFCRNYADTFTTCSDNIIMTGGTGLGKTHLSLAIANEAIKKGFGVIYCSVSTITAKLENEHFGRGTDEATLNLLNGCDLLILDDLGTEFSSQFSSAAIYGIVNTRLLVKKPTIISTNLTTREMVRLYSERFASRIIGSYKRLVFAGKDVRQQKRMERR
ncbi:MAG TPA: ATP-binding protein [Ruminococcaceae bacterium]|jgi:DNA replication protein DnaC|nr:ATP-binding protein [Oscillospiraceae bacterium]